MPRTDGQTAQAGADSPSITPLFPLLLLETMRDMDRPDEVLEGEDLTVSMPRRLGLSDVVFTQIHRFREESRRKRLQTPATVADLIRLVIRRPDAAQIFEQAGRSLAERAWNERSGAFRRTARFLPPALAMRSARRAAERLFRQVLGGGTLRVSRKPLSFTIESPLSISGDPGGAACAFYSGILAETLSRYTGRSHAPEHARCTARGAPACEWTTLVVA